MITIVKVYDKQQPNAHREYCGRRGKGQLGLLGNPFWMSNESQRNKCCDEFQVYFDSIINCKFNSSLTTKEIQMKGKLSELVEIARTTDIELACFCSPKRCHTETIKAYIEEQLNKPVMTYVNGEWVDARTLVMSNDTYTPNDVGERYYNQTDGKY